MREKRFRGEMLRRVEAELPEEGTAVGVGCGTFPLAFFGRTADHRAGRLPAFVEEAGFDQVERYGRFRTGFGVVELLRARPSSAGSRSPRS